MSTRSKPEAVQVVKKRRDSALRALVDGVPYISFLGIEFDRRGDELTGVLPFSDKLIGNPLLQALHGGVTASFLEVTSIITLSWEYLWEDLESGALAVPRPSTLPSITCARACRAMPMRARGSTGRGGAMPRCMSRHGRTTAASFSRRQRAIS